MERLSLGRKLSTLLWRKSRSLTCPSTFSLPLSTIYGATEPETLAFGISLQDILRSGRLLRLAVLAQALRRFFQQLSYFIWTVKAQAILLRTLVEALYIADTANWLLVLTANLLSRFVSLSIYLVNRFNIQLTTGEPKMMACPTFFTISCPTSGPNLCRFKFLVGALMARLKRPCEPLLLFNTFSNKISWLRATWYCCYSAEKRVRRHKA